jgi:endoglucanase
MRNILKNLLPGIMLLAIINLAACEKETQNTLTVTPGSIEIPKEGGVYNLSIKTDAASWHITNPNPDWIELSAASGTEKATTVSLTVNSRTMAPRHATLTIGAGNARPVEILINQPASGYLYTITVNQSSISFDKTFSTKTITVNTNAPNWQIESDVDWLQFSQKTGAKGNTTVSVSTNENTSGDWRYASITISAQYAIPVQILLAQKEGLFPNYNTSPIEADAAGMGSNAVELAARMKIGWNIGNTLEATGGETAWGNPLVSAALIDLVKQNGFNAIRIPCSWNQHLENSTTAKIKTTWLNRVREVVRYCVDRNLYVILNIHWDGGWLENHCTEAKKEENNARQKAFWQQIATHLREFDEHLLFASANEPNVENAIQMEVLNSYHQTFIDAVRSTGGKNAYRVLIVQGPSTDIEKTSLLMNVLPTDQVAGRMMMEVHYYTPYQFCLMTEDANWGKMFYYWGKDYHSEFEKDRNAIWGEESTLDNLMGMMKNKFVDNGIPVILGEFGVIRRSNLTGAALDLHLASRAYFLKYLTKQAIANGLIPFYWDPGFLGTNTMALFDRRTLSVYDQLALDAIMEGANK